jgi:hypothetical protein
MIIATVEDNKFHFNAECDAYEALMFYYGVLHGVNNFLLKNTGKDIGQLTLDELADVTFVEEQAEVKH